MKDEIKAELDGMVEQDNIRKVHEPTVLGLTVLLCTCIKATTKCEYATSIQNI